ncbi:substrate-binding domain-containing protein [Ensifer sp. T173]|uniref:Substrate-binding domain-containing protein n=1 Tax=Ensifer canadensis TaxID=555315 RepID=A0AAW4FXK9_9HYPH|nr:LacI family DNA-binding transcriptional regulator [Ensifer canadensis]MBM3096003.1 substrate-binding domain-containing protein [Ensifer canadensis]NOV20682.1 LacI family DNA-binding transcriptional regulator [Ensifer canadensis]UBI79641.1 LacI family DNA-binding transcriptional regulator [Ensifer canadensis]
MSKPNYRDIARLAGVGTATVERVVNGRGGVRAELVEKVVIAARSLNYPRLPADTHRGLLRIEVLLVRPETTFYRRLANAFERIAETLDPLVIVHRTFTEEMKSAEIARRIMSTEMTRAGLILAVPNNPTISAAVEAVVERGLPVVHVVTRASETKGEFVGIDNYAAGRTAAHLIARMTRAKGSVVALCHPIYQVHRERIRGFSDYFHEHPGSIAFEWLGFTRDDELYSAETLVNALKIYPDLVGLYNAGGANSALIDVLRRDPRGRDLLFVGHELTDYTRKALRDGIMDVVLDQAPEAQAQRALDLILRRIGLTSIEPDLAPIRFITITPEGL